MERTLFRNSISNRILLSKKNLCFLFIFVGIVLFDFTVYKYIWGVENIARIYNAAFLILITLYIFINILRVRLDPKIWIFYMLPGFAVFMAYVINMTVNIARDISLLSYIGNILPWVVFLSIPLLLKHNIINTHKVAKYYYFTMLIIVTLGMMEYFLLAFNLTSFNLIETPNGTFLSGKFSLLHGLEGGIVYFKFYASLGESGSLAMVLLPAIVYGIFYKRYLGLLVLSLSFYLTDSLGGYISIALLLCLLPVVFGRASEKKFTKSTLLLIYAGYLIFLIGGLIFSLDWFFATWQQKDATTMVGVGIETSRSVRMENITGIIYGLPSMLINHPLGFEFADIMSADQSLDYYGSNVGLGIAAYYGGTLAVFGYIILSAVFFCSAVSSFLRRRITKDSAIISLSIFVLFPFFVQRGAIFETSLLLLLLCPFVINYLEKRPIKKADNYFNNTM